MSTGNFLLLDVSESLRGQGLLQQESPSSESAGDSAFTQPWAQPHTPNWEGRSGVRASFKAHRLLGCVHQRYNNAWTNTPWLLYPEPEGSQGGHSAAVAREISELLQGGESSLLFFCKRIRGFFSISLYFQIAGKTKSWPQSHVSGNVSHAISSVCQGPDPDLNPDSAACPKPSASPEWKYWAELVSGGALQNISHCSFNFRMN